MNIVPTTPQNVGQVLDAGFRLFRASFKGTVGLALIASVLLMIPNVFITYYPGALEAIAGGSAGGDFWAMFGIVYVLSIAAYVVFFGAVIHYCDAVARSLQPSMSGSLKVGLGKSPAMVAAVFLYLIAFMLGLVLLVIPGLILMISLFFYANRIVLENEGPVRALRVSHRLVWGNWWRTFLIFSVVMIIYMVIYLAIGLPLALVDGFVASNEQLDGPFSMLGQTLATTVALPYMAATVVTIYYDLRLRSEGGDLASRVDELAPTT